MRIFYRADGEECFYFNVDEIMKRTGKDEKQAKKTAYSNVMRKIYSPSYGYWLGISHEMASLSDKFKDAKLVKYKMTEEDKRRVRKNPDAIMDIPRYYVPTLDRILSSDAFEKEMKNEFYKRFLDDDPEIIKMINVSNRTFRAVRD